MKIALINDSHFGARNDSSIFLNHFVDFYENTFFPFCEENDIKNVIHLGDFFDRRKYVNFNTLSEVRTKILNRFETLNINVHLLLGNHDTFYKNTNKINSPKELLSSYSNMKIYEQPEDVSFDDLKICLVPWINAENKEETLSYVNKSNSPIACGHFELNGYEVMRGVQFQGGMSDSFLKRFELVLSGHFHNKNSKKNVVYLGTQYQITFSDLNDSKGFHVLDTTTRELEFIKNDNQMFYSIDYDDDNDMVVDDKYRNKFIRVIVQNKKDNNKFENFVQKLYDIEVADLSIVEDYSLLDNEESDIDLQKNTLDLVLESVDLFETSVNKNELKTKLKSLYMEALKNESD